MRTPQKIETRKVRHDDNHLPLLASEIHAGIAERGFHFLGEDKLAVIFDGARERGMRIARLLCYAEEHGFQCEANPTLSTARFTTRFPAQKRQPSLVLDGPAQPVCEEPYSNGAARFS